jgi:hypothetical protein
MHWKWYIGLHIGLCVALTGGGIVVVAPARAWRAGLGVAPPVSRKPLVRPDTGACLHSVSSKGSIRQRHPIRGPGGLRYPAGGDTLPLAIVQAGVRLSQLPAERLLRGQRRRPERLIRKVRIQDQPAGRIRGRQGRQRRLYRVHKREIVTGPAGRGQGVHHRNVTLPGRGRQRRNPAGRRAD